MIIRTIFELAFGVQVSLDVYFVIMDPPLVIVQVIVGLPAVPSPFAMDMPVPAVIVRPLKTPDELRA
jgi:hypothetical protein